MATATATLFYGIFVSTPSLIFAADAQVYLEGPLDFINLILNRKFTLLTNQIEESINEEPICMKVPPEIWDLIRKELFTLCLKKSELDFVDNARCDEEDCCSYGGPCEGCGLVHGKFWKRWEMPDCDACHDNAREMLDGGIYPLARIERIEKLLKKFGLKLQSRKHIQPEEYYDELLITLTPITIIANETPSKEIEASPDFNEMCPGDEVISISQAFLMQGFKNHAEYKKRFEKLRKTYRVKAKDPDTSKFLEVLNGKKVARNKKWESGINPRWLLWVSAEVEDY